MSIGSEFFSLHELLSDRKGLGSVAVSLIVAGLVVAVGAAFVRSDKIAVSNLSDLVFVTKQRADADPSAVAPITDIWMDRLNPKSVYAGYITDYRSVCEKGAASGEAEKLIAVKPGGAAVAATAKLDKSSCATLSKYKNTDLYIASDQPLAALQSEKAYFAPAGLHNSFLMRKGEEPQIP